MKTKTNNSLLSYCDLPNDKIKDLGLSFRNIGKKCHYLSKKYIKNDTPPINAINEITNNQKKLRRNLSNWVNDPKNVVDSKGKYIGDKYGAKITICTTDGLVLHDVETFCRDVRNRNSRILGSNNNFVYFKDDFVEPNKANKRYLYSTINVIDVENSNIKYSSVNAYKVKSSSVPSSDPNSSLMQYLPNETADGENVTIVSGEIMDDHTARKEIIQAACGRYGYAARVSRSGGLNYYVCKYVEGDDGMSVFCRLSYFKFPDPTVIDVAAADGRFTTLVTAVKAAGLVQTLSSPGPFTVFAPTDAAFSKLPAGTVGALLADVPQLQELLKYHVVAGKVMAADVVKLSFAKTLADGLNVSIRVENGKVFINDSQVIITDIPCANGVIHVIDTVLLKKTTYDLLVGSKKFNTLISALNAAGLATLSDTDPFTIFAPTDAAFAKLPAGTVGALLANVPQLQELLKYHVVAGKVMAADIINAIADGSASNYVTTLAEKSISINKKNGHVILNDSAKVTITDVLGSNGVVIHVIDTVLSPQTIYQLLKADQQRFGTLVAAIDAADIALTLSGNAEYTLFAPNNDAFSDLPAGALEDLLRPENRGQLEALVGNHASMGSVSLVDDSYVETVSEFSAYIDKNGDKWLINGVNFDQNNPIVALNGKIRHVEKVLLLQSVRDMVKHIDALNEVDKLLGGLPDNSEVKGALDDENVTLFAPVNSGVTQALEEISEPQAELVESILKKHIVIVAGNEDGSLENTDLDELASENNSDQVLNLAGSELTFTKTNAGVLKVNGTKFKKHDIKCKNGGTIHIIEKVLA